MNILLVDDDYYIVEAVKTMIDWEKTGIDGIYTALDASSARQIMENIPIQIILCDIEMGKESGLDLVEWARGQGNAAKVISLTSYADFTYAQKAVTLQSFDYLLKPVSFPRLESLLTRAAEEISREEAYHAGLEKWLTSREVRKESFWKKLLLEEADEKSITRWSEIFDIKYEETERFLYICISVYDYETIYEKLERGMFDFLMGNITQELFSREGYEVQALFRTDTEDASQWNMVLSHPESGAWEDSRGILQRLGEEYIGQIERVMHSKVSCYIGGEKNLAGITLEARAVIHMQEDDVLGIQKVKFLADYEEKEIPYVEPAFRAWEELFLQGETDRLLTEISLYEKSLGISGDCNANTLKLFLGDFQQMLYSALHKKNISLNRLMKEPEFADYRDALRSLHHCRKYTESAVRKVSQYIRFINQEKTVVDTIKDYIEEHLDEDLTREDFAALVFLNADYLAKLFKQETGFSIGSYLTERKMAKARQLLASTVRPVNQIAMEAGYTNFSYFTKLFRKNTGMTPNEYRKSHRTAPSNGTEARP